MVKEVMRPIGVEHRLIGAQTVDAGRESCIGIDRGPGERPFGERERDLLHLFLLGGLGFHRELLLSHAPTRPRLTAREQAVLRLLLTELTEREIGAALGLTPRTTHQYAVAILEKVRRQGQGRPDGPLAALLPRRCGLTGRAALHPCTACANRRHPC